MKQKLTGKWLSFVLAFAMLLSLNGNTSAAAAKAKNPKLNKTSVTLNVGQSKKVTIKNKPAKAKVTWQSKKKTVATVKNGKITGVSAGKTTVTAKVVYKKNKKKSSKNLKVSVTVKAATAVESQVPASQAPTSAAPSAAPSAASSLAPTNQPPASVAPTAEITPTPERTPRPKPSLDPALLQSNLTDEHESANGITTKDNGLMRKELSALDHTPAMGLGWNVGNSLEQTLAKSCTSLSEEEQAALTDEQWVEGYETNAENVVSNQKLFDGLKTYGINTIRIPVAWTNMMEEIEQEDGSTYYKINDAYFNRVEEVMNYCLNDEMYVIINIHWDNGWWGMFGDEDEEIREKAWKKYEDFWKQICARYQEYSDRVIFEGGNEELGERLNDNWRGGSVKTGVLTKEEYEETARKINQKFVDIVRESGINSDGTYNNNRYRMLLIPGINTNIHDTCSSAFSMPEDIEENGINKLFASIHYYDPIGWGIAKSASEGYPGYADTWGSEADYEYLWNDMQKVYDTFTSKGYGVIFGECGVVSQNKDGVVDYLYELFAQCLDKNVVPVMWDEGTYVDRSGTKNDELAYFVYDDVGEVFSGLTSSTPYLTDDAKKLCSKTGAPPTGPSKNQDPLVVATWEGDFMRNTTTSASVDLDEIREMFGDEFINIYNKQEVGGYWNPGEVTINPDYNLTLSTHCSPEWWHSHFQLSDWSQLKEPCIRITMHDDDISQSADLQMGYATDKIMSATGGGGSWKYEEKYEQVIFATDENGDILKDDRERAVVKRDENGNMVLADTAWIGKVMKLDPVHLEERPVIVLTTTNYLGVDFVKVEICDAAYNADGTPHE